MVVPGVPPLAFEGEEEALVEEGAAHSRNRGEHVAVLEVARVLRVQPDGAAGVPGPGVVSKSIPEAERRIPRPGAELDVLVDVAVDAAVVRAGGDLQAPNQREHVPRHEPAGAEQLVAAGDLDVAETAAGVVHHSGGSDVILPEEEGDLDLRDELARRRELRAQEHAVLALAFELVGEAGLLGEVAVLDTEADAIGGAGGRGPG